MWHAGTSDLGAWIPLLVGACVFYLRPRSRAAQLLLIIGVSLTTTATVWVTQTVALQLAPPYPAYPLLVYYLFWGWLLVPSILLLVWSFPRVVWPLTRWPRLVPTLVYGVPALSVAATLVSGTAAYFPVLSLGVLLLVVSLVGITIQTYRTSHDPLVRAQTGWLILGVGLSLGLPLVLFQVGSLGASLGEPPAWLDVIASVLQSLALPICLAIAILRYHLFDIAVIVRRTLIYGTLSVLLGAVYFGSVVSLQTLLKLISGQQTSIGVVVSTLVIAVLFNPLRWRVQDAIDRRFYRTRYDSLHTVRSFALRSRDMENLDEICGHLVDAVETALRPSGVRLWLRPIRERGEAAKGTLGGE